MWCPRSGVVFDCIDIYLLSYSDSFDQPSKFHHTKQKRKQIHQCIKGWPVIVDSLFDVAFFLCGTFQLAPAL